ncbi:hypothetical protein HZ994_10095 [Akkermansiaceae bacterium]|nr:hypothetical protein HZ994_10095 [Akkermansiaceae bacterium]
MQNYCKTIGALAAASALAAGNASAEIEYELHAGYSTDYLFRGIDLGNDLVETGLNLSTEWNGLDLSAGAWYGAFESNNDDFSELDLYAEASKDFGFLTAAVGYISYQNMNSTFRVDDTQELYLSLSKEFFGLDTSLTYFWEIEDSGSGTGGYLEAAVGKSFELSPCLTLNAGAALAYLVEESEFAHITTKVSLDWAFTETATLSPYIAASWGLTNDPRSAAYNNVNEEFVGGTMLTVSF